MRFARRLSSSTGDIAADLRQKTGHLLKASAPDLTRKDSKAEEVSRIQEHRRSRSNGQVNASSGVTHECRTVLAFIHELT
jgi:hypothetical protein